MKLLYITIPSFFDLEISLIRELSSFVDIRVLMITTPVTQHSSAFSIDTLPSGTCIKQFSEISEMEKYKFFINLQQWYLASSEDNNFFSNIKLSKKINKFAHEFVPDIIHLTSTAKSSMPLIFFLKRYKKILTLHDPISHNKLPFYQELARNYLMRSFHNLLFLSKCHEKSFNKLYSNLGCRIFYSRLGVYDFLRSYQMEMSLPEKYILFFGRIDNYKGLDILAQAYKKTKLREENVKIVLAGSGRIPFEVTNEFTDDFIVLNRYILNEELAALIKKSLFVVLPYKTATQSGCLFSAYAFDKPVLATSVGDFSMEIQNGTTGILTQPNDVDSLAQALDAMLDSDLKTMEENIHKLYNGTGEYSWNNIACNLVRVYNDL